MSGRSANEKGPPLRDPSKSPNKRKQREAVLELRMADPDISQKEIAEKLNISRGAVRAALEHNGVKLILQQAEQRINERLISIREEAVLQLEDMVKGFQITTDAEGKMVKKGVPPQVQAAMIKFALEAIVNKSHEPQPSEIEFETIINEAGIITQTVKKNFENSSDS